MTKPEILFARLELSPIRDHFTLQETPSQIHERLYEVLKDEFYARTLTRTLEKLHPEIFADWVSYKAKPRSPMPQTIRAMGKFAVLDQKVDLVDIRFY